MKTIFTIGHSNHPIEFFLELLREFDIDVVVDVRSTPASAYSPQFNQRVLEYDLKEEGIQYMHMPEEFGARHTSPGLLDKNGQVDFDKVQQTPAFNKGVERLKEGAQKGYNIALMCAEANPLECHRFAMISAYLARNGYEIHHILKNHTLVKHEDMEEELLGKYEKKLPKTNLFETVTRADQLKRAYKLQNADIGYKAVKEQ